ncbi:hypothetical protein [Bradyrhizobium sp. URHD0069]|uniref:hypothetical protein n=1 Tax=Bradyrhizobium sp. URHD0069 TaxID=1380355 RepID=UPI0012DC548F|nr:hypothetical protein [Bradyrhizobium sp. URHD0069]
MNTFGPVMGNRTSNGRNSLAQERPFGASSKTSMPHFKRVPQQLLTIQAIIDIPSQFIVSTL